MDLFRVKKVLLFFLGLRGVFLWTRPPSLKGALSGTFTLFRFCLRCLAGSLFVSPIEAQRTKLVHLLSRLLEARLDFVHCRFDSFRGLFLLVDRREGLSSDILGFGNSSPGSHQDLEGFGLLLFGFPQDGIVGVFWCVIAVVVLHDTNFWS